MIRLINLLFLASSAFLSLISIADEAPKGVDIKALSMDGNGCPKDSFFSTLSADKLAFTVSFSKFAVSLDQDANERQGISSKDCTIRLDISIPIGWQYTIKSVNIRGFANLDPGVNASLISYYSFLGAGYSGQTKFFVLGPWDSEYVATSVTSLDQLGIDEAWSPCYSERPLFIKPTIEIKRSKHATISDKGFFTTENADADILQTYSFAWRKC